MPAPDSASLPEKISVLIRGAILEGRFARGSQIVESRLAREMGVGQNAVREALHKLEFEGFVTKTPNLGTFVASITRTDLDAIYRLRIELEALAVYWAREKDRPGDEDLRQLFLHLEAAEQAARVDDLTAYAAADTAFHRALWKTAGNQYLEKCLELVAVPLLSCQLIESEGLLKLDLRALAAKHREWIQAIRNKPPRIAYIYTRNLLSSLWGEVESAVNAARESPPQQQAEPLMAVAVSPQ